MDCNKTILYLCTDQDINNDSIKEMVRGTFSDSVKAFFKIGQKKINEKLQSLSSDADKNVADWKQMSGTSIIKKKPFT